MEQELNTNDNISVKTYTNFQNLTVVFSYFSVFRDFKAGIANARMFRNYKGLWYSNTSSLPPPPPPPPPPQSYEILN